ncbi:MAG: ComF family protein [Bacteroidia bacterium]|nr:ComF family protein [Bacteroidia bacterium]
MHIKEIKDSVLHLIFPHICSGCGNDLVSNESCLCLRCIASLPETNFHMHANNPMEKIFWGRLPVSGASAQYYFTKESLIQHLMHQFKYRGNKDLGFQLGRLIGNSLLQTNRFGFLNALVPLPLFPSKEKKRGFNQATVLCDGIADILRVPVLKMSSYEPSIPTLQTKKGRIERWENIEGKFLLENSESISNKHILLVDDVITTGATLEACGAELIKGENVTLSMATLCIASH